MTRIDKIDNVITAFLLGGKKKPTTHRPPSPSSGLMLPSRGRDLRCHRPNPGRDRGREGGSTGSAPPPLTALGESREWEGCGEEVEQTPTPLQCWVEGHGAGVHTVGRASPAAPCRHPWVLCPVPLVRVGLQGFIKEFARHREGRVQARLELK